MAVPKRRKSKARTAMRRAAWRASVPTPMISSCSHCNEPKLSHRICPHCGIYRDRQVLPDQRAAAEPTA